MPKELTGTTTSLGFWIAIALIRGFFLPPISISLDFPGKIPHWGHRDRGIKNRFSCVRTLVWQVLPAPIHCRLAL